jgi:hypothetical protein
MAKAISKIFDEILTDMGEPLDGTGFWTRQNLLDAFNLIQRQINLETENLLKKTSTIEPAADATEITIDSAGNLIRIVDGYRLQTTEGPIGVYTREQIEEVDRQWNTRTGSLVLGLITDTADEGKALLYPIPDNANNDIFAWYIAFAAVVNAEVTEAGDASDQLSSWVINGVTSSNTDTFVLYYKLTNAGSVRTVTIYKDSAGTEEVATGSVTNDGTITLSASNDSGITGWVTVAYSGDDTTVSANTLTFGILEMPEVDLMALRFGIKWMLYKMDVDGKNEAKSNFYLELYGYKTDGRHTGQLQSIKTRLRKKRQGSENTFRRRREYDSLARIVIDDTAIVP